MKKKTALWLAILTAFSLTACGGEKEAPEQKKPEPRAAEQAETKAPAKAETEAQKEETAELAGDYIAAYCFLEGEEINPEGDLLTLYEDETGVLTYNGDEYSLDWKYDGSAFEFTDESGDMFEGVVENGVIMGVFHTVEEYEYVFEPADGSGGSLYSDLIGEIPGRYALAGADVFGDGEIASAEDLGLAETWLRLEEDGSFELMADGSPAEGTYTVLEDTILLDLPGVTYEGFFTDGMIGLDINTVVFYFSK